MTTPNPTPAPPPDPRVDVPGDAPETPPAPPAPAPAPTEPTLEEKITAAVNAATKPLLDQIASLKTPPAPAPAPAGDDDFVLSQDFSTLYSVQPELVKAIIKETMKVVEPRAIKKAQDFVNQRDALVSLRDGFYKDNPDLAKYKQIVAAIADDLARSNPTMKLDEALKEAATRARKQVKAIQDDALASRPQDPPPVLPGGGRQGADSGSGAQPAPERPMTADEELQADIEERRTQRAAAVAPVKR